MQRQCVQGGGREAAACRASRRDRQRPAIALPGTAKVRARNGGRHKTCSGQHGFNRVGLTFPASLASPFFFFFSCPCTAGGSSSCVMAGSPAL